jgi:hypothetical protein
MLAIDDYLALAVFAISLDNCDHLWGSDGGELTCGCTQETGENTWS